MITILTEKISPCYYAMSRKTAQFALSSLNYKILYLNKMLFKCDKIGSALYSFCNLKDKTLYHLYYECGYTNYLRNQLRYFYQTLLIPHH